MTLDEIIAKLNRISDALPSLILKNTEVAALGALALVDLRIVEEGKNANGQPFDDYTPSYKKKKKAAGRYRGHVDFTLSGQMLASTTTGFQNIAPTERTITNGNAKVVFGGRDDLTRKKLEGNNKKRPGFLNPSKAEIDMVERSANENLKRDIDALP